MKTKQHTPPTKGEFIQLPEGKVYYEYTPKEKGKTIVMVHGFAGHSFAWDHNFDVLKDAGFAVLRFDLYGRGFSDKPKTKYTLDLFVKQIKDLLENLGIEGKINLVGVSMGGAITTQFAQRYPEMVERLCLIAPFGFPVGWKLGSGLAKAPVAGDILNVLLGGKIVAKSSMKIIYHPENFPEINEQIIFPIQIKGFKRAILSTYRNLITKDFSKVFHEVGKSIVPVMLCWGRQDQILPFSYGENLRKSLPNAAFYIFEEAGHFPQYEHPEKFNALLLEFLKD